MSRPSRNWYKILELDELPEGRVKTVTTGVTSIAMTHFQGQYGALDNKCPVWSKNLSRAPYCPGKWHTEGFVAAVLTGSDLLTGGSSETQAERVHQFFHKSSEVAFKALGVTPS